MQCGFRPAKWLGIGLTAFTSTLLGAAPAGALDSFAGTRSDQLVERQHSALMTLEPDRAELVVRRVFYNGASISDQAELFIDLPPGAVATRLRTRGIGPGAPWFEGELLEAEKAAKLYQELTGLGGYYPKDPALLSWRDQTQLALQVFPCPPRAEKVVEYTLELPTVYERGAFRVRLPALGTPLLSARVQLTAKAPGARLSVDGKAFASGGVLPSPGDQALDIALSVPMPVFSAELVSLPFGTGRVLTRYELRAAPQLSTAPKGAYVVVVVDASRSTHDDFELAARSSIEAYLSHFEDARVEILTFDRRVRRELGGFRTSDAARIALRTLTLPQANGSAVDQALFQADQLLAQTPATAPRRIVLLTDGLTRQWLTAERLRGALASSGAIVHVGLLSSGAPWLRRQDDHAWADAIRATGGLVWEASAPAGPPSAKPDRQALSATFEEWVRPLRIDRIAAYSDNHRLADQTDFESLSEGEGAGQLYVDPATTRDLSFTGELWSKTVRVAAGASAASQRRWAALVFGSETLYQLSEAEMMTLALVGRAVSPVTSYLAIEPGVRPSTEGLTEAERIGHGFGFGRGGLRMGGTAVSGRAPQLDRQAFLEQRLQAELGRCGGRLDSMSLEIETTLDEIVNVVAQSGEDDASFASCMTEAAWALKLPAAFDEAWASFNVNL